MGAQRAAAPVAPSRDSATLVRLILEQQVSLASGRAAFERLAARIGAVDPAPFLALDDDELRTVGFSRQKARYFRLWRLPSQRGSFSLTRSISWTMTPPRALLALVGVGP